MILGVHAIVGGAVANAIEFGPMTAFFAGWASHYLCDSIPHWDYQLLSAKVDRHNPLNNDLIIGQTFYSDLAKLSSDALIGLVLALVFFVNLTKPDNLIVVLAGVVGGLLPDLLQFVYMKFRRQPFIVLQKIHNTTHSSSRRFKEKPLLGFLLQLVVVMIAFMVGNWRLFF